MVFKLIFLFLIIEAVTKGALDWKYDSGVLWTEHTHGWLFRESMWKLFEYKNKEYYDEIDTFRDAIFEGTEDEDNWGGIDLNEIGDWEDVFWSYSKYHTYNPITGKGFNYENGIPVVYEATAKGRAIRTFATALDKYKWSTHVAACWLLMEYHRNRAHAWLGRSLHVLQDMSVPWHTTHEGNTKSQHRKYEKFLSERRDYVSSLGKRNANKIIEKGGKLTLSAWIYLKSYPKNRGAIISKGGIEKV